MKKKTNVKLNFLALLPFLLIAFLYEVLPLIMMILSSFRSEVDKSVLFLLKTTSRHSHARLSKSILNSLKVTAISALFGILIGFIGAQAIHNSTGKLKNVFITILNMTSNFAGVPLAFAYMIILGNSGVLIQVGKTYGITALANFDLYTSFGLNMMYVYFQVPLATLLMVPAFYGIRQEWKEANLLLNGNSLTFWFKVGIPVLLPSILEPSASFLPMRLQLTPPRTHF